MHVLIHSFLRLMCPRICVALNIIIACIFDNEVHYLPFPDPLFNFVFPVTVGKDRFDFSGFFSIFDKYNLWTYLVLPQTLRTFISSSAVEGWLTVVWHSTSGNCGISKVFLLEEINPLKAVTLKSLLVFYEDRICLCQLLLTGIPGLKV